MTDFPSWFTLQQNHAPLEALQEVFEDIEELQRDALERGLEWVDPHTDPLLGLDDSSFGLVWKGETHTLTAECELDRGVFSFLVYIKVHGAATWTYSNTPMIHTEYLSSIFSFYSEWISINAFNTRNPS